MVSVGASILIAVVTAAATVALNETARFFRERAARRRLAADWTVTLDSGAIALPVRVAIVENVGHAVAFNVRVTISGDADYEIHSGSPRNECRPRDGILVMVSSPGTGLFRIDWTDAKGIEQGPVFRFPPLP